MYYKRHIDERLMEWKNDPRHKPLLIRGARQVGKSTAVRAFAQSFKYFAEVNLEKQPDLIRLFPQNIHVKKTCEQLSGTLGVPILPGETLLFIDEIQMSKEAIMSLRYFAEDYPELHVIAAGSLLEFALEEIPSFGVGRIRSIHMYPFSFDEFLMAQGLDLTLGYKRKASSNNPLAELAHKDMVDQLRTFYLVGGMPAAVSLWIETHSYLEVSRIHTDIIQAYEDDFNKYKQRVSPVMLRQVLRSVTLQAGNKFVYAEAAREVHSSLVRDALHLLTLAGLATPVKHTDGTGVPLGAEENSSYVKYLFFDLGVMLTMLGTPAKDVLLASDVELVNKGKLSEVFAGLEMMKYRDCFCRPDLYYWQNTAKGSNAEVDYLCVRQARVLPVEVKAGTRGGMQSLWIFMRKRGLEEAVRTSLENFGQFDYYDPEADFAQRHVDIVPLYALSNLDQR